MESASGESYDVNRGMRERTLGGQLWIRRSHNDVTEGLNLDPNMAVMVLEASNAQWKSLARVVNSPSSELEKKRWPRKEPPPY
jgi:hypothetical protein